MELRATPDDAGTRLDAFLAGPLGSRARAQRLIEAGAVLVDGRPAPKLHLLAAGEAISVDEPAEAPAADLPEADYAVPYADEHLLVVDKPAGVVVHPARGHRTGTLAQALAGVAAGGEDAARAGIGHRLDRDTSGLLVVARSEEAHRALRARTPWLWLPVGVIAGGAFGNMLDRIRDGAVTDFIDPMLWPAFNVADVGIVVGILGLLYVIEGKKPSAKSSS